MITYGFSQQGKSHIQKGVVCQDSHQIEILKNGWRILIIADGVGSAKHSEDGSRLASETVADFCKKNIQSAMTGEQILEVLKNAYQIAFRQIELFCQEINGKIEDYDTTLTTVIYTGTMVYYGHAGDGGVIVKYDNGCYEMITVPQKGMDGISVRPLRAGAESWDFGIVDKRIAAVLLATDGMLDTLLPPLLNLSQLEFNPMIQNEKKMNVYITLAEFLMNADSVYNNLAIKNPDKFLENFMSGNSTNEQFNHCLKNAYSKLLGDGYANAVIKTVEQYNYTTWKVGSVTDDRTIVCAINNQMPIHCQSPKYYAEPDWKILQSQYDRMAYPSLSTDDTIPPIGEDYIRVQLDKSTPEIRTENENHMEKLSDDELEPVVIKKKSLENSNPPRTTAPVRSRESAVRAYEKPKGRGKKINILRVIIGVIVCGFAVIGMVTVGKGIHKKFDTSGKLSADSQSDAEEAPYDSKEDNGEEKSTKDETTEDVENSSEDDQDEEGRVYLMVDGEKYKLPESDNPAYTMTYSQAPVEESFEPSSQENDTSRSMSENTDNDMEQSDFQEEPSSEGIGIWWKGTCIAELGGTTDELENLSQNSSDGLHDTESSDDQTVGLDNEVVVEKPLGEDGYSYKLTQKDVEIKIYTDGKDGKIIKIEIRKNSENANENNTETNNTEAPTTEDSTTENNTTDENAQRGNDTADNSPAEGRSLRNCAN